MQVQPYLFFNGSAEAAAAFYRQAIGAEIVMMMRNRESPEKPPEGMLPPGSDDKVMHMALKIGDGVVMASDGMCSGKPDFKGFSLSLTAPDKATGERWFGALGEDGKVDMPFGPTFFSPGFGMVTDKFGLQWMIVLDAAPVTAA